MRSEVVTAAAEGLDANLITQLPSDECQTRPPQHFSAFLLGRRIIAFLPQQILWRYEESVDWRTQHFTEIDATDLIENCSAHLWFLFFLKYESNEDNLTLRKSGERVLWKHEMVSQKTQKELIGSTELRSENVNAVIVPWSLKVFSTIKPVLHPMCHPAGLLSPHECRVFGDSASWKHWQMVEVLQFISLISDQSLQQLRRDEMTVRMTNYWRDVLIRWRINQSAHLSSSTTVERPDTSLLWCWQL